MSLEIKAAAIAASNAISGTGGDDVLIGTSGVDTIRGFDGNDTLEGLAGGDTLDGGNGEDTASYVHSTSAVNAYLIAGGPSSGDAAGDVFISIENLVGTSFNDQLYGDPGVNKLYGGAGNDTLYGWGGDDWLYGGDGTDNVVGGSGHEHLYGGAGIDTLSYQLSPAGVTISLLDPSINTGDAAGDVYAEFEDVTGTMFDDVIYGDGQAVNNLYGLAGNDRIYGGDGYDVLIGDAGADYLDGGAGRDLVDYETAHSSVTASFANPSINTGDAAGDVYVNVEDLAGGIYNDILYGDAGDNNILGWPGDDQIYGGDGNDGLEGGPGADRLDGGAGLDAAGYSEAGLVPAYSTSFTQLGVGVTASLQDPSMNTGEAAGDTYFSIENLIGSTFADHLLGDANNNTIQGQAGNDWLQGGGGDDLLDGGTGADQLDGGAGYDYATYASAKFGVVASLGDPSTNYGDSVGDTYANIEGLMGSDYSDVLVGDNNANRLQGGLGDDALFGGGGDDFLYGGPGKDQIDGGAGFDTVSYETAASGVTVSLQNANLNTGEAAGDTYGNLEAVQGSLFDDTIYGYDYASSMLFGNAGNDKLVGGYADDILIGGPGADQLIGGEGVDIASYVNAAAGVVVDMMTTASEAGEAAGDTFSGIETIAGSAFADLISGNDSGNTLIGGDGNDYLFGRGGNDGIEGGAGGDYISGGDGLDTALYAHATEGVVAFMNTPWLNAGEAAGDRYDSVENMIGSSFADVLGGSDVQNTIFGGDGNDYIFGAGGDDLLEGGTGGDYLDGQSGYDYASYTTASTGITLFMGDLSLSTNDAKGDVLVSIEGILGTQFADLLGGDAGANTIQGYGGSDVIYGGGSTDYLLGGDGDDLLIGGSGADILDGGPGGDVASYGDATAGVVADLTDPSHNTGDALNDRYIDIEGIWGTNFSDTLGGNDGNNLVYGFDGNDILRGYGGDDNFYGGAGTDTISGGSGADTFFFLFVSEGGDTITDFQPGVDRLFFSEYWFQLPITPAQSIDPARFTVGDHVVAANSLPGFLFDTSSHQLLYDPDGNGPLAPSLIATFSNGVVLSAPDLWQA